MKIILIIMFLGSLLVCNWNADHVEIYGTLRNDDGMNGEMKIIMVKQSEGVVLTDPQICSWIPSEELIEEFEVGLIQFLNNATIYNRITNRNSKKLNFVISNLKNYKRQYIGKIINGKHLIYCNFLTLLDDYMRENWYKKYMVIHDGGAYFFDVKYDVQTKEFFDLMINGEA